MSVDGANIGVPAEAAMKAAMSGKQPKEKLTKEKMLEQVLAMGDYNEDAFSYDGASMWLAKQFYLILKDGIEGEAFALYNEMKKRNGNRDYGFSGFMVGWANNCARWLLDKPEQPNPALITIEC